MWIAPVLYFAFLVLYSTAHLPRAAALEQKRSGVEVIQSGTDKPGNSKTANPEPAVSDLKEQTQLDEEKQHVEELQTYVKERADELEKLITGLTIGAGIYTALLGLFAYFGLKEAKSDADRLIGNYKEQLDYLRTQEKADHESRLQQFDELKQQIRADIPSLIEMQQALRDVLLRLRAQLDMSQIWTGTEGKNSYGMMTEEQRQRVMLAEMAIASVDYFRLPSANSKTVGEIYGHLTDFYSARAQVSGERAGKEDETRASIYANRACEAQKENPEHFVRRGVLILSRLAREGKRGPSDALSHAEADLRNALEMEPKWPAALYSLAWIADEKGDFNEAVQLLDRLIAQRNELPSQYRGRRLTNAFINRACARAKNISREWNRLDIESYIQKILEDCTAGEKESTVYGRKDSFVGDMKREWGAGGDLHPIVDLLGENQRGAMERLKS
jgi:tetratricopeptide (TPR) repeat protein